MNLTLGVIGLGMLVCANLWAEDQTAAEAARKITGKYTGEWSFFAWDKDHVIEKSKWTDVLVAGPIKALAERVWVEVRDEMTFEDGTKRTSHFIEGYFSALDMTAGERFYEIDGKLVVFSQHSDNDWSFRTTPDSSELSYLGFDPARVISASHITLKSTTRDGKIDTDHVSRVTTVAWKDAQGAVKSTQFVSMRGHHTRVKN